MPKINFGLGTYKHTNDPVRGSELVNVYAEVDQQKGEENVYSLIQCAGLSTLSSMAGVFRGFTSFLDIGYAVIGQTLYKNAHTATPVAVGTINGTSQVTFAPTRVELVIEADEALYLWDDVVLTDITSTVLGAGELPSSVTNLNGLTIIAIKGSDKIYTSNRLNAGVVGGTAFGTAEAKADKLVRIMANELTVWAFGEKSIELQYDSGRTPFPLTRYNNAMHDIGLLAKHSAVAIHGTMLFLAHNRKVMMGKGTQADPITPPGIGRLLDEVPKEDIKEAFAFGYSVNARDFYCLTVPGHFTIEFDLTENIWHTRKTEGEATWRAKGGHYIDGTWYTGDAFDGSIHAIDDQVNKDGDKPITIVAVSPPVGTRMIRSRQLAAAFDIAVGADTVVKVSYSDDHGATFKNETEHTITPTTLRLFRRGMGQFRTRRFRVEATLTSEFGIHAAFIGNTKDMK